VADSKYQHDTERFDFIGIDLNRPPDSVKPGKLPYGLNIRSYLAGRIEPREGLTDLVGSVALPSASGPPFPPGTSGVLADIVYALAGPYTSAPTIYFYIIPPQRNAFYRSTWTAPKSHALDWSAWTTESIPTGEKPIGLCTSGNQPDANICAVCEDARFLFKPRGAASPNSSDQAWQAIAAPTILTRSFVDFSPGINGHWAGDPVSNPPHAGDPNNFWFYTLGTDGICHGIGGTTTGGGGSPPNFLSIQSTFGAISIPNQAAPAGTWNKMSMCRFSTDYNNLFGTNQIAYWRQNSGTTDWTTVSVPSTNLVDFDVAVTGNGSVGIAVGTGSTPIMGCNDLGAFPQVWFSVTPPVGWDPVRPRVAFSPNFNEFPTTRGTWFIIGGKVGAQNDVIKVKMDNSFLIQTTASAVTVPTVDATQRWTGIAGTYGEPGMIIVGQKNGTSATNADFRMITNPADSAGSSDDNAWSYRTLSQAPFTS